MQVLTQSQVSMLKIQYAATAEAADLVFTEVCHVVDAVAVALTSDKAVRIYRNTWETIQYVIRVFVSIAFLSGCIARIYFEQFMRWQAAYVERCQGECVSVTHAVEPAPEPEVQQEPVQEPAPVGKPRRKVRVQPESAELNQLTTHELRRLAVAQGHKGAGRWTKARLVEVLMA